MEAVLPSLAAAAAVVSTQAVAPARSAVSLASNPCDRQQEEQDQEANNRLLTIRQL